MCFPAEQRCGALHIVQPSASGLLPAKLILEQILRADAVAHDTDPVVIAWPDQDAGALWDSAREDKPAVVVGMIPDEVHAAGRARGYRRCTPKNLLEPNPVFRIHERSFLGTKSKRVKWALAARLNCHQPNPSCVLCQVGLSLSSRLTDPSVASTFSSDRWREVRGCEGAGRTVAIRGEVL